MELESKIPPGPLAQKWEYAKSHFKLVNPANKRKYDIIVVGAGLAGGAAAATMAELGYNVKCFVYHDSPRRPRRGRSRPRSRCTSACSRG